MCAQSISELQKLEFKEAFLEFDKVKFQKKCLLILKKPNTFMKIRQIYVVWEFKKHKSKCIFIFE